MHVSRLSANVVGKIFSLRQIFNECLHIHRCVAEDTVSGISRYFHRQSDIDVSIKRQANSYSTIIAKS